MSLHTLKIKDIISKVWRDHHVNPVIHPPFPDVLLADPIIITPQESPDKTWHLFAHGVFGLYHYTSPDGLAWSRRPMFVGWGHLRPFIYIEKGTYYLFYEKIFNVHRFPFYDSRLELKSSTDLINWSKPTVIVNPSNKWHKTKNKVGNIGSPWVIKVGRRYRLYISTGLVHMRECRFCEPRNIGYAIANKISGPYKVAREILNHKVYPQSTYPSETKKQRSYRWPVSVRLFRLKDGYLGLMTMYFLDKLIGKSRTEMRLVSTKNGLDFTSLHDHPIISPDQVWKKSHVYVGYLTKVGKQLRIYYNARNGWLFGREAICLSVTKL